MDPNESEAYEFLDLSEVNDNERNEILSTLTFEQNTRLKPIADPDKDDTVSSASIDPSLLFDDNQRRSSLIKSHQQQINGISTTIKNEQITNDNNNNVANNNNKDVVNQNGYAPLNSNHNSNNNININNNNVLFTTSVSSGRTRLNSSSATGKRFTANSRKSPNNDATIPMSQQSSISNLTATSIDSNISAIDSNSNLVKAHHLPKIVKSHVEHPVKARVNTKTCVASTLKATNTAMAHSQPGSHQVSNQQQQQQQTSPSQQQQQQQQSSQQQLTPAQSATQQSQQIVNTSPSASQQNNNYVPHGGGTSQPPVYNQMHPGNLYMPSHSGGPIYPTVIPAGIPPNVYVNNVTANVNLHGWAAHPVSSYMPGGPQHYMSGELPQAITADQSNQVMQSMQQQCMPANTGRGPRRGRGRNNNNNNRRNDYIQRQQQDSPAPQEICNAPNVDPQTLANAGYSQYAYQYPYQTYYGGPPQNHLIHPQAQQSGVPPLYVASTIPMYPSHPIYNYSPSLIYPSVMHPAEYPFDENSEEQRPGEAMLPQVWHQPIYPEEYVNHEMMAPEEINHNAPSLASSETPSMLSPGYQIYDPQIQQTLELQQQMNVLHIYEEQQIQTHPQHVPQIEDDISECSLQMQADAVMQPIMPSLEQSQPHHILPNQGIPIEASTLDQSTGSDHSLHDIHVTTSTSNAHSPESSAPDSNINQSLHQPIGAINYGKSVPQSPHQQIHQYAPNAISNTKDNIRDYNQNVPNVPLQMNAHVRNQLKENIQNVVPHYNPQVEELPCQAPSIQQTHSSPPQQQQQQLHQQPPPQQQQQQSHQPPLHIQQQQPMHQPQNQPGQQLQHQGQNQQSFSQHHRNVNQEHQLQTPIVPPNNTTVQCNDSTLQQTNTAQVVNKTMTWTNSHTKKSTASVAVTATPTSTLKPFSQTKSSASTFNSTNNNHQQATTTHQPQVKNYGVTKTPSSPVAASHSNNNTSNSIQHQLQSVPSDKKFSGSSTTTEHKAAVSTTSIASTVVPQQLQPQLPVESSRPQTTQPTTTQQAKKTEMLNLAPPISTQSPSTTTSSPSQSWASLFVSANTTNFTTSLSASSNSGPALPPPFSAKKPIAKVAPYEGITPVQPPPIVTPGAMSYSAASAQGLLQSNANQNKQKSTIDPATPQLNRNNNIDEGSYKFAAFLTKFETDFTPVSLKPRGLTNPSNYCYINSILQALMACAPFYNLIKSISKQHSLPCSEVKTPTINAMLQFISEFTLLPQGFRQNRPQKQQKGKDETGIDLQCDSAFEPTAIYKLWNDSRDEHAEGRQEDAEEFLGFILNKLNDEMLEIIKCAKPAPEQNGGEQTSENEEGAVWQMILNNRNKVSATRQTDFGKTPLSDIFRGELRSRLQREGEHSTDVIQPFFTLQLNIEKAASVKEALEILVGRDQLEGVTGSKSKQEVVAWQQMSLEKLPLVLILHLKWFDYKSDGCTKIVKTVEFPVELKIDAKILASKKYNPKLRVYRLFAVVYHDGKEACKGHYITDVYHTGYCSWLRFNDNTVKPISENNVLRPRESRVPYLLYYRRVNK